jgi:hypothetical protein
LSPHAALPGDALRALQFILAPDGGWIDVRSWAHGEGWRSYWHEAVPHSDRELEGFVRYAEERCDREVRLSLPRSKRGLQYVARAACLWAVTEGKDPAKKLARFRPAPTIVLREGTSSRLWAIWALNNPAAHEHIVRANKRIAHRLGTAKKWADPDALLVPAPGSCLREGRARPCPVVVAALQPTFHTMRQIVGQLRDAPDPMAWRERVQRAA